MVALTQARPETAAPRWLPPRRTDDLSDYAHRQLIGYIGAFLPLLLWLIAGLRPTTNLERWRLLGSVSAYYYTGAVAVFVGLLVALSLFLLTYRGYDNKYHVADRTVGIIAGLAAICVAVFPTGAPSGATPPAWWSELTGTLHYVSATVLFAMFAVFAFWLFRLGSPGESSTAGKRQRNAAYIVSGLAITVGIVWAGLNGSAGKSIFVPECLAVEAFAISWLIKGRALRTASSAANSLLQRISRRIAGRR